MRQGLRIALHQRQRLAESPRRCPPEAVRRTLMKPTTSQQKLMFEPMFDGNLRRFLSCRAPAIGHLLESDSPRRGSRTQSWVPVVSLHYFHPSVLLVKSMKKECSVKKLIPMPAEPPEVTAVVVGPEFATVYG